MPPDPVVAGWMLEYVLRQLDIEDRIVNKIFFILPLPSPLPLRLHKTLLLRRLAADLCSGRSPCLRTLHTLELLDDLPSEDPASPSSSLSKSMTAAYCAAARHSAVDALRASADEDGAFDTVFLENLRDRVSDLDRAARPLLQGEPLRELKAEIEAAVVSRFVRAALMERGTMEEALESGRVFLRNLEEEMGPPFMEMAAEVVMRNKIKLGEDDDPSLFESSEEIIDSDGTGEWTPGWSAMDNRIDREKNCSELNRAAPSSSARVVDKHAGTAAVREVIDDKPKSFGGKFNPLPTPVVEKIVKDLKSSCSDLKMAVNDPLPDAAKLASEIMNSRTVEAANSSERRTIPDEVGTSTSSLVARMNGKVSTADEGANDVQEPYGGKVLKNHQTAVGAGSSAHLDGKRTGTSNKAIDFDQNNTSDEVPKYSIMDRNPTAHTVQWGDDSIDSPSEKSPASSEGLHLPSPKRNNVSPLRLVDYKKCVRRRKIKRWSSLEEAALINGVEKHGKGNWKTILNCYRDIFEERTECDLKDKWRNMRKY